MRPGLLLVCWLTAASAALASAACDLTGLWTWSPVAGRWSNWPPTYNISHDIASGTVHFPGFVTPTSVTTDRFVPRDAWSYASGVLNGSELRLTLHGVPTAALNVTITGVVHPSCEFIDMEGALPSCSNSTFRAGVGPATQAFPDGSQRPGCAALTGPTCSTPDGYAAKCPACKGDVCGCPGATTSCKVCLFCQLCELVPPPPPPPLPLTGGMFGRGGSPINMEPSSWIKYINAWLVRAASACTANGQQPLRLPACALPGGATPAGMWLRGTHDVLTSAAELLPNLTATVEALEFLFRRARSVDGAMPAFVGLDGSVPGTAYADRETGSLAVAAAEALIRQMATPNGQQWFLQWEQPLARALNATVLGPSGLVHAGTSAEEAQPGQSVAIAGDVLYSSVLFWNATNILAELYESAGAQYAAQAAQLRRQATHVKAQITKELWNETYGAFVAATELESDRISVWGNALAAASGLASESQSSRIYSLFRDREADIFFEGQARWLPKPQYWNRTVATADSPAALNFFRNGGFSGRPMVHILSFLGKHDHAMACRLLHQAVASFRSHGIHQWVGPFYPAVFQGPIEGDVSSAAGVYFGSKTLRCAERKGTPIRTDDDASPTVTTIASSRSSSCDLNGEWSFVLVGSNSGHRTWPSFPPVYNLSHNVAAGNVSFQGYVVPSSIDQTPQPEDGFSHATGTLHGSTLLLTLHDVGRTANVSATGKTQTLTAYVHPSCDFIDVEGAPYMCPPPPPPAPPLQRAVGVPAWPSWALDDHEEAEVAEVTLALAPNCSTEPGVTCYTPRGIACKCNGCHGDVCGCGNFTKQCKPCFSCSVCAGPPKHPHPAPSPPPPTGPVATPLVGGMFSRGGSPHNMKPSAWLRVANAWLLRSASICSTDGQRVPLLTPGFPLGYVGQWMRDSYYGISSGLDLLPSLNQTVRAVEWVYRHARPVDGCMPQSVDPHGDNNSFYEWGQRCNQTVGAPQWRSCIDLDSGPFAIKMAAALISAMPEAEGVAWFTKWEPALVKALKVTTLNPNGTGLPWISPSRQLIGVSFRSYGSLCTLVLTY